MLFFIQDRWRNFAAMTRNHRRRLVFKFGGAFDIADFPMRRCFLPKALGKIIPGLDGKWYRSGVVGCFGERVIYTRVFGQFPPY